MENTPNYYKIINIEDGKPSVESAIKRLTYEINHAKKLNISTLKLIHGYGSSGVGGKIRIKLRQYLDSLLSRRLIKGYTIGERFSIFDEDTRNAFNICGSLRDDPDLERHNNGITFVFL